MPAPQLKTLWARIQFRPPWWAILLNPFFIVRRGLYIQIRRHAPLAGGRVLDFGAGSAPYRSLFQCAEYVTVDLPSSGHPPEHKVAELYYDGHSLPFAAEHFDFVLCSEVLEHVFNLDEVLTELYRVLKPSGRMLLTVPFVWGEHESPHDFARYTTFALNDLLRRRGFEVESLVKTTRFVETLAQMGVVYLSERAVFRRVKLLKLIAAPLVFAPLQLCGIALGWILPRDATFYLNAVVLVRKPAIPAPEPVA
jgi:SAM-dependent methyltransferase